MPEADALTTKVYDVTSRFPLIPGDARAEDVMPLATAITGTIDPRDWETLGGRGTLRVVFRAPSVPAWLLVVNQTEAIHAKIDQLLTALAS